MVRFGLFFVTAIILLSPRALFAEDACNCYCGSTGQGAALLSGATYTSSADCKNACEGVGQEYIVCAKGTSDMPLANASCWTQEECALAEGLWGDTQPAECPLPYHYCYPVPTSVPLNVSIGSLHTTLPIGDYINVLYTYALGIAAIVAVVMIMIGGAQYMVGSRGNTEEVSKAKDRIRNATIGLVLLLSAYLLLSTVNPYLVRFKVLQVPKIKPSLFLQGSCEDFDAQEYGVQAQKAGEIDCGDQGTIVSDPHNVPISRTCIYETCPAGNACVHAGSGYTCLSCAQASTDENFAQGFVPSAASCSALTPVATATNRDRCVYVPPTVMDRLLSLVDVAPPNGICSYLPVQCSNIRTCADYSRIEAYRTYPDAPINQLHMIGELLSPICEQNPCAQTVTDGPCTYKENANPGPLDLQYQCLGASGH